MDKPALISALLKAPHHQGGHSESGMKLASQLDIPFPITMASLKRVAKANNLSAASLWPWLSKTANED